MFKFTLISNSISTSDHLYMADFEWYKQKFTFKLLILYTISVGTKVIMFQFCQIIFGKKLLCCQIYNICVTLESLQSYFNIASKAMLRLSLESSTDNETVTLQS